MSGMEMAMGGNAKVLPKAHYFAQSLRSLADEQKIVSFYAKHITVENTEWMESMAKETLSEELIRTLRDEAQQKVLLSRKLSKVFAKEVLPLLSCHSGTKGVGSQHRTVGSQI